MSKMRITGAQLAWRRKVTAIAMLCGLSSTLASCVGTTGVAADEAAIRQHFSHIRDLYSDDVEKALRLEAKTDYANRTIDQYMACRFGPGVYSLTDLRTHQFADEKHYFNFRPDPDWRHPSGVRPGDDGSRVYVADFLGRTWFDGTPIGEVASAGHVGIREDGRVVAFLACVQPEFVRPARSGT